MRKVCHAEFGHDTGMFSVHQLHPEMALRFAGSVTAGLARNGTGLQKLITELDTGLVIVSNKVTYAGPLTFFSGQRIDSAATVSLRADGRLVIFDIRHRVGAPRSIAVRIVARPVRLSGGPALDAAPVTVDERVRALFDPDEIVPSDKVPSRCLRGLIGTLTADAEELGGGVVPLFIGRSDCEFADQWLHARLPSLVATARERLLLDGSGDLAVCVKEPIAEFHGEFFRPMYFGDHGRIATTAYRKGTKVYAVHRVHGALPPGAAEEQRPLSALALETF